MRGGYQDKFRPSDFCSAEWGVHKTHRHSSGIHYPAHHLRKFYRMCTRMCISWPGSTTAEVLYCSSHMWVLVRAYLVNYMNAILGATSLILLQSGGGVGIQDGTKAIWLFRVLLWALLKTGQFEWCVCTMGENLWTDFLPYLQFSLSARVRLFLNR